MWLVLKIVLAVGLTAVSPFLSPANGAPKSCFAELNPEFKTKKDSDLDGLKEKVQTLLGIRAFLDEEIPEIWKPLRTYEAQIRAATKSDREKIRKQAANDLYKRFGPENELVEKFLLVAELKESDLKKSPQKVFERLALESEVWSQTEFAAYHQRIRHADPQVRALRTVIELLAQARRHKKNSQGVDWPQASHLDAIEADFQEAFLTVFKRKAPIQLKKVTRLSFDESHVDISDRTTGLIFINAKYFRGENLKALLFYHGLRLSFPGFNFPKLEKGFIEILRQSLFEKSHLGHFENLSQAHQVYQIFLSRLFTERPDLEKSFLKYFKKGDVEAFEKALQTIETDHQASQFLLEIPD